MTDKEYKDMQEVMERHHQFLMSNKEAAINHLKAIGIWHLLVPIKKSKTSRPPRSARNK